MLLAASIDKCRRVARSNKAAKSIFNAVARRSKELSAGLAVPISIALINACGNPLPPRDCSGTVRAPA